MTSGWQGSSGPGDAPQSDAARVRRLLCAGVAIAVFSLYVSGVASTLTYGGDCGELIAASYRLGIAHPTGYPLYCLLGRLFSSLLPLGEVAWRYNVLSALCGATAVGLMTATVHRLTNADATDAADATRPLGSASPTTGRAGNIWPALGAGLLLAGFHPFWTQSVIAEVYSLNALMLSALLFCAVAWHQSNDWRWAYSLAVVFGLALNAHLSCAFLAPGLLLYAVVQHHRRFQIPGSGSHNRHFALGRLGVMLLLMLAAYALTLYLPLRARGFPEPPSSRQWWPLDWTHPADAGRWYAHVSAKQYKSLLFTRRTVSLAGRTFHVTWFATPFSVLPGKLAALLGFIALTYLWFTPLFLVGAVRSWRGPPQTGGRWLGAMLLLAFVLNIGIQINYNVGDQMNFFFPAYIVMAIWMGLGLSWLWRAAEKWAARLDKKRRHDKPLDAGHTQSEQPAARWHWRAMTGLQLLLLATVAVQWGLAAPHVSWRGRTAARDTALEHAAVAEQLAARSGKTPSLLLLSDDALWGFWYAQYVLGRARNARTPWGLERNTAVKENRLAAYVSALQRRGPVALSAWDEGADRCFPYVMLTPDGSLCLASRRVLPPPAMPLPDNTVHRGTTLHDGSRDSRSSIRDGRDGVLRAGFRMRRVSRPDTRSITPPVSIAELKRDNLAAFEVDFRLPWTMPLSPRVAGGATLDLNSRPPAMHTGWIEVLMTPAEPGSAGYFAVTPPPAQGTIIKDTGDATADSKPALIAWKQRRRLIVPRGGRAGAALRAVVPLQMESGATLGRYNVWLRLVRSPRDAITPWQRLADVQLTRD